jgi:CxxC motif-containing protein (DUF1111 family)
MRALGTLLLLAVVGSTAHAKGGGPLPGLTPFQLDQFNQGFAAFRQQLFPAEGLGPAFNQGRCYGCHSNPALGGRSKRSRANVTRFGRVENGVFIELPGGSMLQGSALSPECAEVVPPEANVVATRMTSSAFGAGLIEAIPEQQILDRAAAEFAENPAAAGRVHWVTSLSDGPLPHVGRFGRKAQWARIMDAVADALVNELGITNALIPTESAPNGDLARLAACDTVPDPEDTTGMLQKLTFLLRYLGPPFTPRTVSPVAELGGQLFDDIGCTFCHYGGYTAVSAVDAIDGQPVPIYSDLLLHDIGTGDDIVQGQAQGNEFRTQPVWLAMKPYLHDGRANTLTEAIGMHVNEALASRDAYFALSPLEQRAVQKFLTR